MATQGPNSAASIVNVNTVGVPWSNPTNAGASDNAYATRGLSGNTDSLDLTDFAFSIPSGATIDNVQVEIERKCSAGFVATSRVKLIIGGSETGNLKTGGFWTTSDVYESISGAPVAFWGLASLSDAQVNASNFGVRVFANVSGKSGATVSIDHIRITITYTGGAAGGDHPAVKRMGGVKFASHGGYRDGSGMMMWRHSQSGIWLPNNRTIIQPENRIAV